jgi:hypothetical protein
MMLLTGGIGLVASVIGVVLRLETARGFVGYWLAVSLVAIAGALLLVRRQALREGEPFLSPPTRRVVQALMPAYVAAFAISLAVVIWVPKLQSLNAVIERLALTTLPGAWIVLYGCAAHAAGFFMQRGIKLFGWFFVIGGCGLLLTSLGLRTSPSAAHGVMGIFFGGLHLAYGAYLYFTEKGKNAA